MTCRELLEELINDKLQSAVMSGKRGGVDSGKVKIRPIEIKGSICYQASRTDGTKVIHKNYERDALIAYMLESMENLYAQLQIQNYYGEGSVLVSRKGKMTVKKKNRQPVNMTELPKIASHNRRKKYILEEGIPVPFLVDLGVMSQDGRIHAARYDKFRQINRFLEFVEDILPQIPRNREAVILDFGCGKSYLTFAMYYYFHELKGYDVQIIGLDLKKDVIEKCNGLAEKYGYDKLHFLVGDIADYEGVSAVDMVVTLHACDTATDYALAKAAAWGAKVILSVPCCQHEVNRQIKNDLLAPILRYGILKERISALLTDGIRANLLEEMGYEVQLLEFIDMEHTPKNILIRGVKTEKKSDGKQIDEFMQAFSLHPTLLKLLREQDEEKSKGE